MSLIDEYWPEWVRSRSSPGSALPVPAERTVCARPASEGLLGTCPGHEHRLCKPQTLAHMISLDFKVRAGCLWACEKMYAGWCSVCGTCNLSEASAEIKPSGSPRVVLTDTSLMYSSSSAPWKCLLCPSDDPINIAPSGATDASVAPGRAAPCATRAESTKSFATPEVELYVALTTKPAAEAVVTSNLTETSLDISCQITCTYLRAAGIP